MAWVMVAAVALSFCGLTLFDILSDLFVHGDWLTKPSPGGRESAGQTVTAIVVLGATFALSARSYWKDLDL